MRYGAQSKGVGREVWVCGTRYGYGAQGMVWDIRYGYGV